MIKLKRLAGRGKYLVMAMAFGAAVLLPGLLSSGGVSAASSIPTNRSVQLNSDVVGTQTTDANGNACAAASGCNGAKTKYVFTWKISQSQNIGSMAIMFCTTPFIGTTCTDPGTSNFMDASTVSSMSQSGFATGAFSIDTTTTANTGYFAAPNACIGTGVLRTNCILAKRSSAVAETAGTTVTASFGLGGSGTDYIKNSDVAGTFYARITTFQTTSYTTPVDEGAVAFAIVGNTVDITSKVQEQLTFSVTATTPLAAQGTSCSPLTGSTALPLGDTNGVLNTSNQYDAHSYFRVYTNATNGTVIQYSGDTLKTASGTAIPAYTTAGGSLTASGTAGFGLGLDSGDATANGWSLSTLAGVSPYAAGNGTIPAGGSNGTAKVFEDTSSVNSPKTIANQGTPQAISCETGSVRYIANVSTTTTPGIYRTSMTYFATPTY